VGTAVPMTLHAAALAAPPAASRRGSALGSLAILAGSLCLRIGVLETGDATALRPRESLGFAQPKNLPRR
ncbi:MAG: hypothetical protein J0H57_10015, partial [Rhodospirillales bacterium]|nr:hypothetical protein [Rhodospirillales bacterium]